MHRSKQVLLAIIIVFIGIQFIQPSHNNSENVSPTDFAKIFVVPSRIQYILKNTCYDCHSNNTEYSWYSHTQPMSWIMAMHIKNGKAELNFSEFGTYTARRKINKLNGIANQIKDDEMPISSYKIIHKDKRLSEADKKLIIDWTQKLADSISVNQ